MALLIVFEGVEGSGKTTQAQILWNKLQSVNSPAITTREPGGTSSGELIRNLILEQEDLTPISELYLFNAARSLLIEQLVIPTLKEGIHVIMDRFIYSTVAYQSYGRAIPLRTVQTVNEIASHHLQPDIVILLDMPPEKALTRRQDPQDRFEREAIKFHTKIREGYLTMAREYQQTWIVIPADLELNQIADIVWEKVKTLIKN
jgi:dTMP kinase